MKAVLKGKIIRKILMKKNKSQNWLAFRLNISSGYMSQLIDGSRHPSPQIRQRFIDMFPELTFDDLFLIK